MWKWIKKILLTLLALILLPMLGLAAYIGFDALVAEKATDFTNVTYENADGLTLHGYLAEPEGEGPHPSILLIHEWWGLNAGMPILADALAEQGYVVLAADAYRGKLTDKVPRALFLRLTTPDDEVRSDLDTALDWLQARPNVDPERTASMGFCFGGGESLQLGLRQSERLAVTVIYYGAVVTDPDLLKPFTDGKAVLGVFGEVDQQIFADDVLEFEAALNSLDITNEVTLYPGMGHGFLTEENFDEPGTPGDAWQQTISFLDENLKNR
ncbi:MAG: dienelactone hydrolase family protein [Anaerolineae bacterium]